jgi:two-component system, OmpR family, sensor kinase
MLRRLSIRLRVTLVFVGVMTVVLCATGVFIYLRFAFELDLTINAALRSRAGEVAALVRNSDASLDKVRQGALVGRAESFAEVIGPAGNVLDSTLSIGNHDLLSPAERREAARGALFLDRGSLPGLKSESRLLAIPVGAGGQQRIVIVGTSTESRAESLVDLLELLLIGAPVALLLASLAAYWVAAAALRPVDEMRARAAEVSTAEPDQRLPVPPTNDEIARLGVTLNAMLDRLGEALAHERRFVADASHELRTPLAILKVEVDLALSQGRSPGELQAALASVSEETDRLIQLAEDLLTIAQTDQGELPLRLGPTDIGEVLDGVALRFGRRAEDGGRAIEVRVEPGLRASVDRLRLDQALDNMVDNALRYGAGTIELSAARQGGSVEIHVRDHGAGFSEDFLPRAFERFSREDSSQRNGGSGLGLSIVDTIVRAHRGETHVANCEGGGADVWLVLPGVPDGGASHLALMRGP